MRSEQATRPLEYDLGGEVVGVGRGELVGVGGTRVGVGGATVGCGVTVAIGTGVGSSTGVDSTGVTSV